MKKQGIGIGNKIKIGQKILIDMIKLRKYKHLKTDGYDPILTKNKALKSIRELVTFQFTCRRCKDSPCMAVCRANALEKNENGWIERSINLCVRCKSCISVCPFGTIMNDLFETKTSPTDVVSIVNQDVDLEKNVYPLTDRVLIKEYAWNLMIE